MENIIFKENALTPEIFCNLSESVGWHKKEFEIAKKAVSGTRYAVCAFDNDECVGMARLIGDGAYSWTVEHVIVLPAYQKNGIGTRLMEFIMAYLKTQIPKGDYIKVFLIAAEGKVPFYKKFGFESIPNEQYHAQPMYNKYF